MTLVGDISISESQQTFSGFVTQTAPSDLTVNGDGTCTAGGGYGDISQGAEVTVSDPAGKVIGTGSLLNGVGIDSTKRGFIPQASIDSQVCDWAFVIKSLPKEPFYKVSVTDRGEVTYTYAQVTKHQVHLTLGG